MSSALTEADLLALHATLRSVPRLEVMVVPTWEYTKPRHHKKKRMRKKIAKYHVPQPIEPKEVLVLEGGTVLCTARQYAALRRELRPLGLKPHRL